MDWTSLVTVIVAVAVAGISYVVARVNLRRQRGVEEGTLALGLVASLQSELDRQRRSYEREIDSMRKQYTAELAETRERIATLQRVVERLERENAALLLKGG